MATGAVDITPVVSIIIPCWNAERYVHSAIESALNQTYPDIEVIVLDDGSTDGSLEKIRSFGSLIRWETGPNRGACAVRNRGIELARGELIQFLDADDKLHPKKLECMVPVAVANGFGCLAICDWETISQARTSPTRYSLKMPFDSTQDGVIWCAHYSLATPSPLHWRRLLRNIGGFDPTLPCAQERDLHLRLACFGVCFVHVPEVLVRAHRRPDSLSSDSLRVLRQHLYIVSKAHRLLEELDRSNDQRSSALAGLLARDARVFLRGGITEEAEEYFQAARALHAGGGLEHAYKPLHRLAARLVGPALFERLVALKRAVNPRHGDAARIASSA